MIGPALWSGLARWSNVAPPGARALLPLIVIAQGACAPTELDGTWRHPADRTPTDRPAYELALGQYGPEVAGVVRLFQTVTDGGDAYARPVFCALVDSGEVTAGVLRFRFRDPDGVGFSASLKPEDDELDGRFEQDDGAVRAVAFRRIDEDVDSSCGQVTETFSLHGVVAGADLPERLRVALVYTGVLVEEGERAGGEDGRFELPRRVVAPDPGAPTFAMEFNTVPDPQVYSVAPSDGSLAFAYGIFIAFDDADGDGLWDRGVLTGGREEVLGVAPDHALVYLQGRGAAVYPDRPELLADVDQHYSLVEVVRDEESGAILRLQPREPSITPVRVVVPLSPDAAPFLETE